MSRHIGSALHIQNPDPGSRYRSGRRTFLTLQPSPRCRPGEPTPKGGVPGPTSHSGLSTTPVSAGPSRRRDRWRLLLLPSRCDPRDRRRSAQRLGPRPATGGPTDLGGRQPSGARWLGLARLPRGPRGSLFHRPASQHRSPDAPKPRSPEAPKPRSRESSHRRHPAIGPCHTRRARRGVVRGQVDRAHTP
jgi:hypothetical protein